MVLVSPLSLLRNICHFLPLPLFLNKIYFNSINSTPTHCIAVWHRLMPRKTQHGDAYLILRREGAIEEFMRSITTLF